MKRNGISGEEEGDKCDECEEYEGDEEVVGSYRKPQEIATEVQAPKALNPEGVEYREMMNVMKMREMRK